MINSFDFVESLAVRLSRPTSELLRYGCPKTSSVTVALMARHGRTHLPCRRRDGDARRLRQQCNSIPKRIGCSQPMPGRPVAQALQGRRMPVPRGRIAVVRLLRNQFPIWSGCAAIRAISIIGKSWVPPCWSHDDVNPCIQTDGGRGTQQRNMSIDQDRARLRWAGFGVGECVRR